MKPIAITRLGIFIRGAAMGAADIVPGVSGGTIALISGIYETLLNSIKAVNPTSARLLIKGEFNAFWQAVNGEFLVLLAMGILTSALTLARLLKHGLEAYPVFIWSFFFGLIIASALVVARQVNHWEPATLTGAALGTVVAFAVTVLSPTTTPEALWFVFLSGALAICAMILPGISGSFILVLLGKYQFILAAVTDFRLDILVVLGLGAVCGLLVFSNVLSWLLARYRDITISILAGFMVGSLNKVWPWKAEGGNLLPEQIFSMGQDSLATGIFMALIGFGLIWYLESKSRIIPSKSE